MTSSPTHEAGRERLAEAVKHMEARCVEIERQTAKYGERWWPEGVVHAKHMRTVLSALPTNSGDHHEDLG